MVGVVGHMANPTSRDVASLASAAEIGGATWAGFADAFWWRDVWIQLLAAAEVTSSLEVGPAMTNAYLRHPFHTVSVLATLQEHAPGRTFLGVSAGGSEVSAVAGMPRRDAPDRTRELIELVRAVADGRPLEESSGRTLEVPLQRPPVLIAARGDKMMSLAGRLADRVLLFGIPTGDLGRSVGIIQSGATGRASAPELIWAPLVAHDETLIPSLLNVAVYASLNSRREYRIGWGLDDDLAARIKNELVRAGPAAAARSVPAVVLDDLVLTERNPSRIAEIASGLGVVSLAVPGFSPESLPAHLEWAHQVEDLIGHTG